MRRRLVAFGWPLLVAGASVSPLVAVLAVGRTLVWRDSAQLYAPHRVPVVAALRSLRLPGWNPWEGTGQPLFAQGLDFVLHPLSLALAPFTSSTNAVIVAAVAFAAIGTWAAARSLGLSRPASAAASFAYAVSGYVLAMSANALYLVGSATGPWAVAGWVHASRERSGWLAAAAATGALVLSGDAGSMVAFTIVGAALAWRAGRWRGLARASVGAALGIAFAGVQLVPSWSYLAETSRGAGLLDPGSVHRWALAPARVVELVFPGFFVGVPRSYVAPVAAALGGGPDRFPFTASIFVGAPVLLLAGVAARRRAPAGRALVALAAVFLWLALGHHAGSQQILGPLPVWGVLRYWEKMVGPLTFCVALAAGAGLDAIRERPGGVDRVAAAGAVASAIFAVVLRVAPEVRFGMEEAVAELARAHLEVGAWHAAAALGALAAAVRLGRRWPRGLAVAGAAVVLLEAIAASPFAVHAGNPAALASRPPALEAASPGARLVSPLGYDFAEGSGDLDAIDLLQQREGRAGRPSTNVASRVDSVATYTGLTSIRWEMILGAGELFWPLARRFGTTHVLSRPPTTPVEAATLDAAVAGAPAPRAFDGGQLFAWEIPHRPWASFALEAGAAPGREAAAMMLGEALVSGRPTVILETSRAPRVSEGRVLHVTRLPEEVAIEAESAADGVLVVNDAFGAGWTAAIDGARVEILPADVLVRAVRWPAGRHRLVMRYAPRGLGVGIAASVLALLAAALLWLKTRSSAAP